MDIHIDFKTLVWANTSKYQYKYIYHLYIYRPVNLATEKAKGLLFGWDNLIRKLSCDIPDTNPSPPWHEPQSTQRCLSKAYSIEKPA